MSEMREMRAQFMAEFDFRREVATRLLGIV